LRSLPVKINSVINYLQEDEVFGMRNSYYNNALASCEKWLQELDLPNVTNLEYLRNCENEIIEMLLNELSAIKAVKFITNHNAPLEPYFHVANIGEYINVGGNYYCVTAGAWYEDIS